MYIDCAKHGVSSDELCESECYQCKHEEWVKSKTPEQLTFIAARKTLLELTLRMDEEHRYHSNLIWIQTVPEEVFLARKAIRNLNAKNRYENCKDEVKNRAKDELGLRPNGNDAYFSVLSTMKRIIEEKGKK